MEVTTANNGGQLITPSSNNTASSQEDNNNKQQYHPLVNNKSTIINNNTTNNSADDASNLNNTSSNNKTTLNSSNHISLLNTNTMHIVSTSTPLKTEVRIVTTEQLSEEDHHSKNILRPELDDVELEVVKDIMNLLIDRIGTESRNNAKQQSQNEERETKMEVCLELEKPLHVPIKEVENQNMSYDDMSIEEKEQIESSPEDRTGDLIIDSEALHPPTSNESQQETLNVATTLDKNFDSSSQEENKAYFSTVNKKNLVESQNVTLNSQTSDSSETIPNPNPPSENTEVKTTLSNLHSSVLSKPEKTTNIPDKPLQSSQINKQETITENAAIRESGVAMDDEEQAVIPIDCTPTEDKIMNNDQEEFEEKAKDMVTLRNLEISPPPPPPPSEEAPSTVEAVKLAEKNDDKAGEVSETSSGKKKRFSAGSLNTSDECRSTEEGGRAKRQRTQTQLFQAGESRLIDTSFNSTSSRNRSVRSSGRSRKKSTTSSTTSDTNISNAHDSSTIQQHLTDVQDVIFYEKNDYLAIRNEENTFYLCQLAENVRIMRPFIRVKWLDTKDGGKTYFLTSHYDKVPQKSILMPVNLIKSNGTKKNEQIFTLTESEEDIINTRLKRSLNAASESGSQQSI